MNKIRFTCSYISPKQLVRLYAALLIRILGWKCSHLLQSELTETPGQFGCVSHLQAEFAIIGHFRFGLHKRLNRPSTYITSLCHPVARTISQYKEFSVNHPHHLQDSDGNILSLTDSVRKKPKSVSKLSNWISRWWWSFQSIWCFSRWVFPQKPGFVFHSRRLGRVF